MLTPEDYAQRGGYVCPACGSDEIMTGDDYDRNTPQIFQNCFCHICKAEWTDTYRLEGYCDLTVPGVPRFPNLARQVPATEEVIERVTATCKAELDDAGIPFEEADLFVRSGGEVPSRVVGTLGPWAFRRAWNYWVAQGPGLPLDVAQRLHKVYGREIRVNGDCTCPAPEESFRGFGVGLYHIDTQQGLMALAFAIQTILDAYPLPEEDDDDDIE